MHYNGTEIDTNIQYQYLHAHVRVAHASAAELYQENHCTGCKNCETVNSIRWCCWNISTDERDVDYWKSEVITLFKYIN